MVRLSTIESYFQQHGLVSTLRYSVPYGYREFVRPHLPKKRPVTYNGITVASYARLGDTYLPNSAWYGDAEDKPDYEGGYIELIRKAVRPEDSVIVVGGGSGVSTAVAAELAGKSGCVTVYEAAAEQVKFIRETLQLNDLTEITTVKHALVGPKIDTYGDSRAADVINPSDLPSCDTILLDCEGSEQAILENLSSMPKRVVVETHGSFGYPTDETVAILKDRDMTVEESIPAHVTGREIAIENDILAVLAYRNSAGGRQ